MAKRKASPIPASLGKYAIAEILGKGAMGIVYKGFDPHIRRTVALKTIRKDMVEDDQEASLLARFRNEAQAAGRLSHPGIVGVYDWGEVGDVAFLAMEYVEGNSLRDYFVRGTRFELRDVVSVMVQLLDALQHAHEQGVWHRDIKPANIIIMRNGKLKIADFGIARIDSSSLTQVGAVMGTPGYMSPEQYSGAVVDWRADIFSAGVVMYQLLTGTRPFTGTPESIAYKICHEQPLPPSKSGGEDCGEQFDAVAMMALAKNPEERFQFAHAYRDAVQAAFAAPVSATLSEATLLIEQHRPSIGLEPSQPSKPSRPSQPSQAPAPPHPAPPVPSATDTKLPLPGWDAATLKEIEQQLIRFIGPIGKVIVRRGAAHTTDIGQLYDILADNLEHAHERAAFLAGKRKPAAGGAQGGAPDAPAPTLPAAAATGTHEPLTAEVIELAAKHLAAHLGPIATVLAKRAADKAGSRGEFIALLAEQLTSATEKAQFLHALGAG
jgi:eukaryotic-like serine/threonine-protein kinase